MNQLVINDLEFCQNSKLQQDQVQGQGSFFSVDFAFDGKFDFKPSGEAAAGSGAAVAVAIGNDKPTVFTVTAVE